MLRLALPCPIGGVPVIGAACNAVTGGPGSIVSGAAGSIFGAGIGAVFDAATQWVANGAVWLLDQVGRFLSASTQIGLGTNWFKVHEKLMTLISVSVILPMAFVGMIQAVYRQSASVLARSFLINLPLALLFTGVAVELVRLGLAITDDLSQKMLATAGVDTQHLLKPVADFLQSPTGATGAPAFVVFVGALVVAVSALVLWLELVVRAAAVAAATLFLPVVLATLVWPAISHWSRRLADTIAALVLSKFVVAAVLSLAVGAIAGGLGAHGTNGGGFAAVITGIAMLLLATLSPFTLLRLIPAIEAGAVAHLESARHRIVGSVTNNARRAGVLALDVASIGASGGAAAALTAGSAVSGGSCGPRTPPPTDAARSSDQGIGPEGSDMTGARGDPDLSWLWNVGSDSEGRTRDSEGRKG